MKKFSKSLNIKINPEPLNKEVPEDNLKWILMKLIDENLKITSYSYPRVHILPTVKITGQEDLIASIIDLFDKNSNKEIINILESLKNKIQDWKAIDDEISKINENISHLELKEKYNAHISKIKNLIKLYGSDSENFDMVLESYVNKLNNPKIILERINAVNILLKTSNEKQLEILNKIMDKLNSKGEKIKTY